jgi:hypothetical protein
MSAVTPIADKRGRNLIVRFVPIADIGVVFERGVEPINLTLS